MADGKSSCDYGFHMSITDWNDEEKKEIKEMTRQGVTSYKLYMAYDNLKVNDKELFEILSAIEEEHGIAGAHCENGKIIFTTRLLIFHIETAVVSAKHINFALCNSFPECLLVFFFSKRRCTYESSS